MGGSANGQEAGAEAAERKWAKRRTCRYMPRGPCMRPSATRYGCAVGAPWGGRVAPSHPHCRRHDWSATRARTKLLADLLRRLALDHRRHLGAAQVQQGLDVHKLRRAAGGGDRRRRQRSVGLPHALALRRASPAALRCPAPRRPRAARPLRTLAARMSSKSVSCGHSTNSASHLGTISARLLERSGFSISGSFWWTWCLQNCAARGERRQRAR
jgi:hypothetical protein